ncbi:Intraflagellar transport protein 56 [Diplonema papillatum]|nr:Intraflagellar transport protein 56 [Diplonema papillatum]
MASRRVRQKNTATVGSTASRTKVETNRSKMLEEFIQNRDFTGAVALLEFHKQQNEQVEGFPVQTQRRLKTQPTPANEKCNNDTHTHVHDGLCFFFITHN